MTFFGRTVILLALLVLAIALDSSQAFAGPDGIFESGKRKGKGKDKDDGFEVADMLPDATDVLEALGSGLGDAFDGAQAGESAEDTEGGEAAGEDSKGDGEEADGAVEGTGVEQEEGESDAGGALDVVIDTLTSLLTGNSDTSSTTTTTTTTNKH